MSNNFCTFYLFFFVLSLKKQIIKRFSSSETYCLTLFSLLSFTFKDLENVSVGCLIMNKFKLIIQIINQPLGHRFNVDVD